MPYTLGDVVCDPLLDDDVRDLRFQSSIVQSVDGVDVLIDRPWKMM